jgi:hypothetical protein
MSIFPFGVQETGCGTVNYSMGMEPRVVPLSPEWC